jgi:hypothetical protein
MKEIRPNLKNALQPRLVGDGGHSHEKPVSMIMAPYITKNTICLLISIATICTVKEW